MYELPLLKDLVILLAASIMTSIVFLRMSLPTIVGLILGGCIIGPYGIGLIEEKELVDVMAEIGVVLLLFTIGLELSVSRLVKVGAGGVVAALLQIVLSVILTAGLSKLFGFSVVTSLLLGFIIALSSTAIVLRLYSERGEMESPHGRLTLGILIAQDLAIVPMVLFLQIFSGGEGASAGEIAEAVGTAVVAVGAIIIMAYYAVPLILHQVVRLKSPEVFTMAGILICLGTAWISSGFGLSLAFGAFIAGVVISESEYSHQITASILPFRDLFNSIFFISIGMLIRLDYMATQWLPVLALAAVVILFKALVTSAVVFIARFPLRVAFVVGLSLAQVGEFSFVLLKIGKDQGLVDQMLYQNLLSSIVLTMIVTPFLIRLAPALSTKLPDIFPSVEEAVPKEEAGRWSAINHVIIAGYGLVGRHLATVLKKTGIPYVILDINHENVRAARREGHTAYYGDTSYAEVLRSVGITAAKVMVFAISDPVGTRRGVKIAREANPRLHIIVRTKYMAEIGDLNRLGADQVIPEEFETSVEIFSRVLREYGVPGNVIRNQIDMARLEGYSMLRGVSLTMEKMMELSALLAKSVSETYYVGAGSGAVDRSIRDLNLRKRCGVTIIAVVRGSETKTNPPPDYVIRKGDILILLGSHAEIASALELLKGESEAEIIT